MKNFIPGIFAVVLAIAFTTFSSFANHNESKKTLSPDVRYLKAGNWSGSDEVLEDAVISSDCPDGTATICAEFYDVDHLFINGSGQVTGVRNITGTSTPYPPNLTLRYEE